MGVPKFYRWISERYPCLSQIVQENQIPDFDNLYLDMNGIIHQCSHPNDDDPHFRITEEQIFVDIFHYIEVLFRIVKPKRVFFMAVDGVAPRAKMNQQRGRRFRSAKEAEDNIRRALQKGQVLPKEERFDSNCITPGTLFMVKLHEQLKYFVNDKVSNDPAWQGLRIYLSGHETPGEGEHKIMDFIRSEKWQPDYDPNTRHCLYGLDADLMMLGLSTHEPHFSLLREEVKFGKSAKRISKPEKITFHLLHLSLFREYIDWEFAALKETLPFPYDLTRIIDDWILMGFLVGNDFIPHLPQLHINHDALPYLYKTYIGIMPSMDGYLSRNGKLNLPRFEQYMEALAKFDTDKFSEEFVDMKWFEKKLTHRPPNRRTPAGKTTSGLPNGGAAGGLGMFAALSEASDDTSNLSPELQRLSAKLDEENDDGDEDDDTFEIEFKMHKRNYYQEKMGFTAVDSDLLLELAYQYVLGIQWILLYYFNGVPSWSWYYPHHYAPYMSDIKDFSGRQLLFDMGQPFKPFEQLLGVLPAASKQLLPTPFQSLMIMEHSPIIEYYPVNFKTDLNGKQQDWEAVVLIPFIDEKRLLEAMEPIYAKLSPSEIGRNVHSACLLYTYDASLSFQYLSSLPGAFPDINCSHARCEKIPREAFLVDAQKLKRGLCDGVRLDVYFPGFPTLYHIKHTAKLDRASVKVFSFHSKGESMVLQIPPQPHKEAIRVAEELLGETCFVGWPHMVEALVQSVSDDTYKYTLDETKTTTGNGPKPIEQVFLPEKEHKERRKQISSLTDHYLERKGIRVGNTDILIEACTIRGRRFVCGPKGKVTLCKEWSPFPVAYPLQLTVKDIHVHDAESTKIDTIEELFPLGAKCFMLASPHYGASGEILEVDPSQGRVRLQLSIPVEPDVQSVMEQQQDLSLRYMPAYVVARKLGITSNLLSRITSKLLVERGSSTKAEGGEKVDIGLNLKNSKQNKEVLGFARRTDDGWTFSPKAHHTVAEYLKKFPQVFDALARCDATDRFFEADISSGDNGSSTLSEIKNWLKTLPAHKMEAVTCGSEALDEPVVKAIEQAVQAVKKSKQVPKKVKVRVRPYVLFRPSEHLGSIPPDNDADFQLFDRVVNVNGNSSVPFELRGTVIGIHQDEEESQMLEVAFDEEFVGGQSLRCSSNKVHLMRPCSLINLSFGQREEDKKKGLVTPSRKPVQSAWASPATGTTLYSPDLGASPDLTKNGPRGSRLNSKPSARASPGNRSRGSPQPSSRNQRASEGRNDKQRRPDKQRKPEDSTEFANMWKDLKKKETGTPHGRQEKPKAILQKKDKAKSEAKASEADKAKNETKASEADKAKNETKASQADSRREESGGGEANETLPTQPTMEESTRALRELLHIGENRSGAPQTSEPATPEPPSANTTPGRRLTVDELFRSQGATRLPSPSPPLPLPNPPSYPSQLVTNWCLASGFPPPSFFCTQSLEGVTAVAEVGRLRFAGAPCRSRPEAMESASSVALHQLQQASQVSRGRGRLAGVVAGPFPRGPLPGQVPVHIPPRLQSPQHFVRGHHSSHPNTGKLPTRGNLSEGAKDSRNHFPTPEKSQSSLSAGASPFVPLQVTRRNTPSKPKHSIDTPASATNQNKETRKQETTTPEKSNQTNDRSSEPRVTPGPSAVQTQEISTDTGNAKGLEPQATTSPAPPPTKKPPKKRLLAPSFFNK